MAMATEGCVAQIGDAAGAVWRALDEKGPLSTAKLVKEIEAPRDLVMQALGWLARGQDQRRRVAKPDRLVAVSRSGVT